MSEGFEMASRAIRAAGFDEEFDYVVVGSGAAGSILANRLTEDGRSTVCVIEAGSWDTSPLIHLPAGFLPLNSHPVLTWRFGSEPTQQTAGRSVPLPQGKVVGGSSSINGMVYNRGQAADFDAWRDKGNPGWGFDDVLPYFKRTEKRIGGDGNSFRGRDGLLPVTDNAWRNPVCEAFIKGVEECGIARNPDYNGAYQEGVGYYQRAILKGRRVSAARAFLHSARRRKNLTIKVNARVSRVLLEKNRATGVEYLPERSREKPVRIAARREVILAAGALNTPKILQLSGIGPGHLLQEHGIPIARDVAGVGGNLRDHYAVRIVSEVRNALTLNEYSRGWRLAREFIRWGTGRPSILALPSSIVYAFGRTPLADDRPDIQFVFTPGSYAAGRIYSLASYPGMTCGFCQQRPESSGFVRIRSSDPFEDPAVQPNYMGEEIDRLKVVAALRMVRGFLHSKALARYFDHETLPGPDVASDDDLLTFARRNGITAFHFTGTARMGPAHDPTTVVDPQLRVHGIDGLRVADASVMPMIVSANTYAATMMIAEKAAEMILRPS